MSTSVTVKAAPSQHNPSNVNISYQVIHNRKVRRIVSGISMPSEEWNLRTGAACERVESDLRRLRTIIQQLASSSREFTAANVADEFRASRHEEMFLDFVHSECRKKRLMGKHNTARNYASAAASFNRFCGGKDIPASVITSELMAQYQSWLLANGLGFNAISCYMRVLRSSYNRLVKNTAVVDAHPFSNVYTGIAKTRKRAIGVSEMSRIKQLKLTDSRLAFARDLFMLSFYLRGISFVDLAFLKKSNLVNGRIVYRRAKTNQTIDIAVNSKIANMLNQYPTSPDSAYLLPIITDSDKDEWQQYASALRIYNMRLKQISKLAGLNANLTSYTARHSWASIAKLRNVELSTISDALGHDNELTTRIYLASLDTGHVDRANDLTTRGL